MITLRQRTDFRVHSPYRSRKLNAIGRVSTGSPIRDALLRHGELNRGPRILHELAFRYDKYIQEITSNAERRTLIRAIIYEEMSHQLPDETFAERIDVFGWFSETVGIGQIYTDIWSNKIGATRFELTWDARKNIESIDKILELNRRYGELPLRGLPDMKDATLPDISFYLQAAIYNGGESYPRESHFYGLRVSRSALEISFAVEALKNIKLALDYEAISPRLRPAYFDHFSTILNKDIVARNLSRSRQILTRRFGYSLMQTAERAYIQATDSETRNSMNPRAKRVRNDEIARPDPVHQELLLDRPDMDLPTHFYDDRRMDELDRTA